MKRSGFKRREFERKPQPLYSLSRPCPSPIVSGRVLAVAKEDAIRSEQYRRLVASLPCINCGIEGYTQHAHANTGKGASIKVDDRRAFPLCTVHPGPDGQLVLGCHERLDQGLLFSKGERRIKEVLWIQLTISMLLRAGAWPAGLPLLSRGEIEGSR